MAGASLLFSAGFLVGCHLPPADWGRDSKINKTSKVEVLALDEAAVDPLASVGRRATVLIFMSVECPICNRYVPEILRLVTRFESAGVDFWLVYPNADESVDAIRKHVEDYQLTPISKRVVRDPRQELVRRAGARITPEVVVFQPGGERVYRGRIDDRFPSLGLDRREPTKRDLEEVLSALVDSKPLPTRGEPAVGCHIPLATSW